ncbi:class F sortase [Streptomyces sp. RKAG337]|uniref:class F sortase n=1 Tax=Streptomyces sp. RKAG337 TaxID=2893404 RepID=UPI002033EECE|nr:class F sortase [Streptomyces sp. RKAG337]MCM2424700.1 class F sortase [Streptomyces sp. RKAG337]
MGRHARPRPPHRIALGSLALLGAASAVGGAVGLGPHLMRADAPAGGDRAVRMAVPAPGPDPVGTTPQGPPPGPSPAVAPRPSSLSIPAIQVRTALETLGLSPTGALQVPVRPERAGWFDGGPVPGQVGPAVVVGHVDSVDGPAVFARLSSLRPGDVITVGLGDGGSVRFRVTAVRRFAKDRFPTAEVYGPQPDAQLRLITCGGAFDGHHYPDDIVVFARLAGTP